MKSFNEFLEDNKDALNRALAMHRFKQKGGKIDKQPPSLDLGRQKYKGLNISTLSKDDQKRVCSPIESIKNGSNKIIMGRSLIKGNIIENINRVSKSLKI